MARPKPKTNPVPSDADNAKSGDSAALKDGVRPEMLAQLPPEMQRVLEMQMVSASMPTMHPLAGKFNAEHIDKILDMAKENNDLIHEGNSKSRWFKLAYVAIGAAIFVFLTIFMVGSHTEVYMKLLEYVVPFLGGVGGGVWLKSYWDRKG